MTQTTRLPPKFPYDKTEEHDFGPNKSRPIYQTKGGFTFNIPISNELIGVEFQDSGHNRVVLEFARRLSPQDLTSIKQAIKDAS